MAPVGESPVKRGRLIESATWKGLMLGMAGGASVGAFVGLTMVAVPMGILMIFDPALDSSDDLEALILLPFVVVAGAAIGLLLGGLGGLLVLLFHRESSAPSIAAIISGTVALVTMATVFGYDGLRSLPILVSILIVTVLGTGVGLVGGRWFRRSLDSTEPDHNWFVA